MEIGFPVNNPGNHVYDVPPVAVRTVISDEQIVERDAVAVMVGRGNAVTVTVAVFVQPFVLVPVTV